MLCLKRSVLLLVCPDANAVVRMTSCMLPDCHQDYAENAEIQYVNFC